MGVSMKKPSQSERASKFSACSKDDPCQWMVGCVLFRTLVAFGKGTATNSHFPAIRHKSICCRRVDFGPKWMDGWDEIGRIGGNVSGCTLKARIGTNEYGNISIALLSGLSSFPMEVPKGTRRTCPLHQSTTTTQDFTFVPTSFSR